MTKIKAIPSTIADLSALASEDLLEIFLSRLTATDSRSISFFAGEELVAIAGIVGMKIMSMGETWLIPSPLFYRFPLTVFSIRDELRKAERELGFIRYQATTKVSEPRHSAFMEWLGYEKEATLKAYNQGEDFYMYRRILCPQQ